MALAGHRRRALGAIGISAALALVLASCAKTDDDAGGAKSGDGGSAGITVGTTDVITALDPAGSYDNGSFAVQNQVYPFLLNSPYGSPDVEPDIAESAEFTSPTEYTVKLKSGLKWANGNDLTSSDVKFSFDRQLAIADPNGPSSLLYNLESTEAPDDLTVVFHLKSENDQIFPQILSSPVGPIVDEDTFSATALTPSADIVKAKAFAGPYTITDYNENELIQYAAFDGYDGLLGKAKTASITAQYFTEETALKLAVQQGDVDVATRSLSPTDLADLRKDEKVKVYDGPGGEIRYIVFNFNTQPYGTSTPEADPAKALAVRQAVAHLLDRDALSNEIYNGAYTPLYSYVPEGLTGAVEPLKELYGDGNGGPDADEGQGGAGGRRRPGPRQAEPAVQPGPLRQVLRRGVRPRREAARGGRPVRRQPPVDPVGRLQRRAHRRPLPGLPARLVPGLLRRRQLPLAVLPQGELPGEPLRQRRGQRPHPQAGHDPGRGAAHRADRADPGEGRAGPVHRALPPGRPGRRRRPRTSPACRTPSTPRSSSATRPSAADRRRGARGRRARPALEAGLHRPWVVTARP